MQQLQVQNSAPMLCCGGQGQVQETLVDNKHKRPSHDREHSRRSSRCHMRKLTQSDGGPVPHKLKIENRQDLVRHVYEAAALRDSTSEAEDYLGVILKCLTGYVEEASLVVQSCRDFWKLDRKLNDVREAVKMTMRPELVDTFGHGDEDNVLVIQGVSSKEELDEKIQDGEQLEIYRLTLSEMNKKTDKGEWKWVDESTCLMGTSVAKPYFSRISLEQHLNLEFTIQDVKEQSKSDEIAFDLDPINLRNKANNTKVLSDDQISESVWHCELPLSRFGTWRRTCMQKRVSH